MGGLTTLLDTFTYIKYNMYMYIILYNVHFIILLLCVRMHVCTPSIQGIYIVYRTCTHYIHVLVYTCTCTCTLVCIKCTMCLCACLDQQKNDELFNSTQLVKMALGVAKGMEYLSGIGFVHRVSDSYIICIYMCT